MPDTFEDSVETFNTTLESALVAALLSRGQFIASRLHFHVSEDLRRDL